jgi:IPT/TIG domain-containing protein
MRQFVIGMLAAAILGAAAPALAQPTLVELRFASEDVPPGGVLQAKVEVTEPRPISTGSGGFDLGQFEEFLGLAANSPAGDAAAAAVIRGSSVRVAMVSPTAGLGMDPDYPILTMTVRVPSTAVPGLRVPLTLASGAVFLDPTGAPYPYSFRAGEVTIAAGPSIANVIPGSGLVPAGGVITVEGAGFEPDAELRIGEVTVAAAHFVSSTRLEAALGQAATMHGRRVEVRNRGSNTRTVYFAYQRTTSLGASAHPLFRVVEPAFATALLHRRRRELRGLGGERRRTGSAEHQSDAGVGHTGSAVGQRAPRAGGRDAAPQFAGRAQPL